MILARKLVLRAMISKWFYSGLAALSLVLGYTVGASSSPVASIIIPALFSLATAASAIALKKKIGSSQALVVSRAFGLFLLIVSSMYLAGTVIGANARISGFMLMKNTELKEKKFPWERVEPPENVRVAIDWIGVQEKLIERGYTADQIEQLYSLPGSQSFSGIGIFGHSERLSDILPWGGKSIQPELQPGEQKTIVDTDEFNEGGV